MIIFLLSMYCYQNEKWNFKGWHTNFDNGFVKQWCRCFLCVFCVKITISWIAISKFMITTDSRNNIQLNRIADLAYVMQMWYVCRFNCGNKATIQCYNKLIPDIHIWMWTLPLLPLTDQNFFNGLKSVSASATQLLRFCYIMNVA